MAHTWLTRSVIRTAPPKVFNKMTTPPACSGGRNATGECPKSPRPVRFRKNLAQ